MIKNISPIKTAITEYYGPPCNEFDPECVCCQAWQDFYSIGMERNAYRNVLAALVLVSAHSTALPPGMSVVREHALEALEYWSADND
jgi:hypothetical protein